MDKNRLYIFTLLALGAIVFIFSYAGVYFYTEATIERLTEVQYQSSQREAKEVVRLLESQLKSGISKEETKLNLQSSIENTNTSIGFICMFNSTGMEICHPDPQKIGNQITEENSQVSGLEEEKSNTFLKLLKEQKEVGGIREFNQTANRSSEIIYLHPVEGTDWMVAAHSNLEVVEREMERIRNKFIIIFLIFSTLMVIVAFVIIRYIGSKYEKTIEDENDLLQTELIELNQRVKDFQREKAAEIPEQNENTNYKNRILCYHKDELVPLETNDIAYVFLEDTVVYIKCLNNKKYHYQQTLDSFVKQTNPSLFFRVNRQTIISINAIHKIYKYGVNQLKVELKSDKEFSAIISKNKIAEFKQWIDC